MSPKPRVVNVALLPAKSVPALIAQGRTIVEKMTGNPHFPSPNPPLAIITSHLDALEAAQTLANARTKGAAADRDVKKRIVLVDLHNLKAYVQLIASNDLPNAEAIITSSTLAVKKARAVHTKVDLAATPGPITGSVKLVARSAGQRASYEWQWSLDQKSWTQLPGTIQARTLVTGLTPMVVVYFRQKSITKSGPGDWGQVVSVMVR